MDAARYWAGEKPDVDFVIDDDVADSMLAFGADPDDVARLRATPADDACYVYAENWDTVQVFLALSTQWRTVALASMAGAHVIYQGIDYSAIEPVLRLMSVESCDHAAMFGKIRLMEEAALDYLLDAGT